METDPVRVMEVMLGIPGVRVTSVDAQPTGLRVELETSAISATCPICRNEAEPAGVEIVEKQPGLRRRTSVTLAAEQHHGWFLEMAVCQKRCEIGVGRNDDPALSSSSLQNDSVACRGEPEVPNVHGVMTHRIEELGKLRGEVLVDEESYAGRRRESSCSRTASAA